MSVQSQMFSSVNHYCDEGGAMTMKRLMLVWVMILCLALSAAAEGNADDVLGSWVSYKAVINGMETDARAIGVEIRLELHADGTCLTVATNMDGTLEDQGTWFETDGHYLMVDSDGLEQAFAVEDGQLVFYTGEDRIIFVRPNEMPEIDRQLLEPKPVMAESEEPFLGKWKWYASGREGFLSHVPEDFGKGITLIIEPGRVTFLVEFYQEGNRIESTAESVFENGQLKCPADSIIRLTDDGSLSLEIFANDSLLYFKRMDEQMKAE